MNTKLTLTLEKEVIEKAKKYAAEKGRSLSELVENYFQFLTETPEQEKEIKLSPKVSKLRGVLKVNSDFDYKKVLEEELLKKFNG
ncbi:hypothetical protein C900_01016 [Fulvivirga imtechensis AK7]|uniref:Antitoxin n=1 Tax=Fulvivirga imtechensis AK7 TaxID=1237149 RepID=L8JZL5_9BACT|nr:DUF6364 family protein [Fulvivirga imtechensis]ELR72637.1 hypothetical protein C900_01016 [Fulvivirga imtechensis AK7]